MSKGTEAVNAAYLRSLYFQSREKFCRQSDRIADGETVGEVLHSYLATFRDAFDAAVAEERADFWPEMEGGARLHMPGASYLELCLPLENVHSAFPEGVSIQLVGPECPSWSDMNAILHNEVHCGEGSLLARQHSVVISEDNAGHETSITLYKGRYEDTRVHLNAFLQPDLVVCFHPGTCEKTLASWTDPFSYWVEIGVPCIFTLSDELGEERCDALLDLFEKIGFEIIVREMRSRHRCPSGRNAAWFLCRGRGSRSEASTSIRASHIQPDVDNKIENAKSSITKPGAKSIEENYPGDDTPIRESNGDTCEGCGALQPKKLCPCGKLFCGSDCYKTHWPTHRWKWHC